MEYSYSKLNDREFESLVQDIISKHLKLNLEKFKAGKDGGVDGRFWIGKKEGILQCKNYWKTGYHGLISKLKKEEVDKVRKLNPVRYLFITSVPLSRKTRKKYLVFFLLLLNRKLMFGRR
ncbi:MAG: restriction endonuclease [Bacteroidales bacterium]|nr:restriction endonuclease [Bacteroidales bacterium]